MVRFCLRNFLWVAVCLAVFAGAPYSANAGIIAIASGSLEQDDGNLATTSDGDLIVEPMGPNGPSPWDDGVLNWSVTFDDGSGLYTYSYTFDVTANSNPRNISHFTVEVSDDFADLYTSCTFQGTDCGSLDGSSLVLGKDPSVPGDDDPTGTDSDAELIGLKNNTSGSSNFSLTLTIITDVIPVWGDAIAKDGKTQRPVGCTNNPNDEFPPCSNVDILAYNLGYFALDPLIGDCAVTSQNAANAGDCAFGWLAVPDSQIVPPDPPDIPEPASLGLFGMGLAWLGLMVGIRRKRRTA